MMQFEKRGTDRVNWGRHCICWSRDCSITFRHSAIGLPIKLYMCVDMRFGIRSVKLLMVVESILAEQSPISENGPENHVLGLQSVLQK
jgi:hypothetical protein